MSSETLSEVPLVPMGKRLIARLADTTESGILIPYEPKTVRWVEIAALAEGLPPALTLGARVVLKQGAGIEVPMEDKRYLVFEESEVLAVLRTDPPSAG